MNAAQMNRARSLALSGSDGIKVEAPRCTIDDLNYALEYAKTHKGSKTLIETIEREIRKKKKTSKPNPTNLSATA